MRKFLLASVATLGTGGLAGVALAQAPAAPVGAPSQGQVAYPMANPTAYVNNNNNYQAPALPGPLANPTPGTVVVHINGKVQTTFQSEWTSADTSPPIAPTGNSFKVNPYALDSFARLYFGADAMATNGLRYGAAIELRENFTGQASSTASSGASGYTSTETVYVRRAFTYAAGENWGIVRFGQADGIIGIFDNGVTDGQFLPNGFNGGDNQNVVGNAAIPFFFLSQAGNEYGNTKLVYLSPQIAGFDFGVQWAPNTSNGYGLSGNAGGIGSGAGIGACGPAANSGCPTLSSSPTPGDGSRATNQTAVGVRYQGSFGGVGLLAYGVYEMSGHVNYTGLTPATAAGRTALGISSPALAGSTYTGKFDGLSFGSGGAALTFAGFTLSANAIGGRLNGQLALAPQGGAPEVAYILGLKYVTGPLTVGLQAEEGWYQGSVQLTGISQRRARGITAGAVYTVAPGFQVFGEYLWEDIHQAGFNFNTNANGSPLNNTVKSQGFLLGNVINF
jgi:outer membrane protein OmpU